MPFEDGHPRYGGQKPGSVSKKTAALCEILESLKFDIPQKIIELLPQLKKEKQADVLLALMEFIYPRRKSVEQDIVAHTTSVENMTPEQLHETQRAIFLRTSGFDIDNKEEREERLLRNLKALEMLSGPLEAIETEPK